MFLAEALLFYYQQIGPSPVTTENQNAEPSPAIVHELRKFGKLALAGLLTSWAAITTVKLSFLALFRRIIDRVRSMVLYWWFVLSYTVLVALYGVSTYLVTFLYDIKFGMW